MWYVEIKKRGRRGVRRLELDDRAVTIGRAPTNTLVLHDTGVSRHHCVLESMGGAWHIRDLGSRHGTHVNGERLEESGLSDGDRIRIGPYQLSLVTVDPSDQPTVNGAPSQRRRAKSRKGGHTEGDPHRTAQSEDVQKDASLPAATRDELGELREAVSALEQGLESRLSALETQLQQSQATSGQLQQHIEENAASLVGQATHFERIESEHGDLSGRVDETQAQLAAATDKLHHALTTVQRLTDEFEPTSAQVAELKTRLDETINSWYRASEQAGEAQDRCDELSQKLNDMEQEKDARFAEAAKLESQLDEVRRASENAQQTASDAQQEREQTHERIEELHAVAQKALVVAEEAKSQTAAAQTQLATIESRQPTSDTTVEVAKMESQLDEVRRASENAQQTASDAQQEQEQTHERIEELHALAQQALVVAEEAKSQTAAAQAQLATVESRHETLVKLSEAADEEAISSGPLHAHRNAPGAQKQRHKGRRVPSLLDNLKGSIRGYRDDRDYGAWIVAIALTLIGITAIVLTLLFTR
ncbi:MAG: FHA domain-containing protein [Phycisphaerales bacterium]